MPETSVPALSQTGISLISSDRGIEEYKLDSNGLKILLSENHAAPVVTLMVLYRVGSRNEGAGFTGATHFLEHMMFKGTNQYNPEKGRGIDDIFKPMGAAYNATTWFDRTNYFECVSSAHLEECIAIEADRMRNLNLKQQDHDTEMTVVRNEFERSENEPDDVLDKEFWAIAFREHPYHWPTIGWKSDVEGVPMSKLKDFYDTFYWPNNAVAILVGDFESEQALKWIAKYFGEHTASPHPIPSVYTVEPPQEGERRFDVSRAGDLPRLTVGFHTPAAQHPDMYALEAMSAILGGGRRSTRLYKRLVDTNMVSSVSAHQWELYDPAIFEVSATVSPEVEPKDVEEIILEEIAKLAKEPPTKEELTRAKKANRKSTILQSADPIVWSQMLGEAEAAANWQWLLNYDDRFDKVTVEDVQKVAAKYFYRENRTVGYFIPREGPTAVTAQSKTQGPQRACFAENVQRHVLDNGLTLLLMENPGRDVVAISGNTKAGGYFTRPDQRVLPSLTYQLLTRGSSKYSKLELGEILEEMGASLGFAGDHFTVNFGSAIVSEDFPQMIDIIANVLREPLWLKEELDKAKKEFVSYFLQEMNDTASIAKSRLCQALYKPGSPYYATPYEELIEQLEHIKTDQLREFHLQHYQPHGTILTIVGNINAQQVLDLVTQKFGKWTNTNTKSADVNITPPEFTLPDKAKTIEIPMPDKSNVDIRIGLPCALRRAAPDYFAARMANAALGQDTLSSRLGVEVRERSGLTYGIHSRFDDLSFGGAPWNIDLSTNPEYIDKALGLVRKVVEEYARDGITPKELSEEAGRSTGNFQLALRTSLGMSASLTQHEFLGLGFEAIDNFPANVAAVTKEQADAAIAKYFRLDQCVTTIAGTLVKTAISK